MTLKNNSLGGVGANENCETALKNLIVADMHVHTIYSDGTLTVKDAVSQAKARGVGLLCITDHDNMNGCDELKVQAKKAKILGVNGIEISAYDGDVKVHVLGYNADHNCAVYKDFYSKLFHSSYDRATDVLTKLKRAGVSLSFDEVLRERKNDVSPIHAMHIARAGARKGYSSSPFAFYGKYLTVGCPAFSSVGRVSPETAVKIIKESGGVSSLAHPGRIGVSQQYTLDLINKLISCGLNGIEAVYSGHTNVETAYYKEIATSKNLLVTGGSDTHFPEGNRKVGVPRFVPDDRLLLALKLI